MAITISNLDSIFDDDIFVVTDGDDGHKSVTGARFKELLESSSTAVSTVSNQ